MQSIGDPDAEKSQAMHERIDSLDDSRLDIFRNLKTKNAVRDARLFVAEGATVVERVLRSSLEVRSILVSDRKFATCAPFLRADVRVFRLRSELADELVGDADRRRRLARPCLPVDEDPREVRVRVHDVPYELLGACRLEAGDRRRVGFEAESCQAARGAGRSSGLEHAELFSLREVGEEAGKARPARARPGEVRVRCHLGARLLLRRVI